jgi:hypothetical protein
MMAKQNMVVIPGKVQKDSKQRKKFKINKHNANEVDIDIDINDDGDYEVDKLSVDGLPTTMPDGNAIGWFNNFAIKQNGQHIKQKYQVKIAGVSNLGKSKLVILDSTGLDYYKGTINKDDTFELTDGDPAVGGSPPKA